MAKYRQGTYSVQVTRSGTLGHGPRLNQCFLHPQWLLIKMCFPEMQLFSLPVRL